MSSEDMELLKAKAKRLQEKLDIKDRKYNFTTYKQWYVYHLTFKHNESSHKK